MTGSSPSNPPKNMPSSTKDSVRVEKKKQVRAAQLRANLKRRKSAKRETDTTPDSNVGWIGGDF